MPERKRRFGDRYDGRRIRTLDPFYKIIPYIMNTRVDSQNYYEDKIDIGNVEAYLGSLRKKDIKDIGFLHIVIAAMVRTMSQKPGLNRFIAGQKVFARNEIIVSLAIKKELSERGAETTVKLKFSPTDTIFDVAKKINTAIEENKKIETQNDTDKTAKIIMSCPGFIVKLIVGLLKYMDYLGILPKAINEASPMHTSMFITDLGSLGIQPIYHHIYEFGTTSIFIAFGTKFSERVVKKNFEIEDKRFVTVRVVTDERTVDGYYYASAFKLFRRLLQHPERLEAAPEQVIEDIE